MSLYRYFKTQGRELPNPSRPLSSSVSSAAIEEANAAVSATCRKEKRGPYQKLSDETRAWYPRTQHSLSIDMFTALILDTLFNAHAHASAVRRKYFLVIVHRRK